MEKTVSHRKKFEGFQEKGQPFHPKPLTLFREYDNGHLSNLLNGGNATNAVRHGMHGIHFSATERLERKRLVS